MPSVPAANSCSSGFHRCVRELSIRVTCVRPRRRGRRPGRVTSSSPPAPPPTTTIRCNCCSAVFASGLVFVVDGDRLGDVLRHRKLLNVPLSMDAFVFVVESIADEVRDRDHHQAMLRAKPYEVRDARHRAVVVDDLAEHAGRNRTCEPDEIDRGFGVTAPLEHPTAARTKGTAMSWSCEVPGLAVRINGGLDRASPLVS